MYFQSFQCVKTLMIRISIGISFTIAWCRKTFLQPYKWCKVNTVHKLKSCQWKCLALTLHSNLCPLLPFAPACALHTYSHPSRILVPFMPHHVISSLYILCQYLDHPAHHQYCDQFSIDLLATFTTNVIFAK